MRAVIQKVTKASVSVNNELVSEIENGYAVLLGVEKEDTEADAVYIADKLVGLRIFEDDDEKLNLSIEDVKGEMLIVSQFTLLADCRKGRRPSFVNAERPERANELYEFVCDRVSEFVPVKKGIFQTHMVVNICNDGPTTIILDSKKMF